MPSVQLSSISSSSHEDDQSSNAGDIAENNVIVISIQGGGGDKDDTTSSVITLTTTTSTTTTTRTRQTAHKIVKFFVGKAAALISKRGGRPHDYGLPQLETLLTNLIDNPRLTLEHYLYKIKDCTFQRWTVTMALLPIYAWRTYCNPGLNAVSGQLAYFAISFLGLLLTPVELARFKSKKVGSEELPISCSDEEFKPFVPISSDEEFKPFVSILPELHYWLGLTLAMCAFIIVSFIYHSDEAPISLGRTVFAILIWFILVSCLCVYNMFKYKYVPFSYGKQTHNGKTSEMGWLKKLCVKVILNR